MIDKDNLIIEDEFKRLIFPTPRKDIANLEQSIVNEGCTEPITVWNGVIVDGHKRYEICKKCNIPFSIEQINFGCKEAAMVWICANQLKRNNITEPARKFLIGVQYEKGKIVTRLQNKNDKNMRDSGLVDSMNDNPFNRMRTAQDIATANGISIASVQKYAIFYQAVEKIREKEPKLVTKLFSGKYKFSHRLIVEISDLSKEELKKLNRKIERNPADYILYSNGRTVNRHGKVELVSANEYTGPSVKDMPEFDPDAEIKSLTLTIPSWQSSIERAKRNTDFAIVSETAKRSLNKHLHSLSMTIVNMQMEMESR